MNKSNSFDAPSFLSALSEKMTESLTDIQWNVLERQLIYGDSTEAIGEHLGVASVRVRHIQSKAFEELDKVFKNEIECFSEKLEKILTEAGGALTVEECFAEFPDIDEAGFILLLAVCQKI